MLSPAPLTSVVGEHHPQEAWFKENLSQIWGSNYQGKFVPNLGEALGKNGNGQSKQHTHTIFVHTHNVSIYIVLKKKL